MKIKQFSQILKKEKPNDILSKYMLSKYNKLTEKQLELICDLGEHHGGCAFKYKNKKNKC